MAGTYTLTAIAYDNVNAKGNEFDHYHSAKSRSDHFGGTENLQQASFWFTSTGLTAGKNQHIAGFDESGFLGQLGVYQNQRLQQ